MQLQPLEFALRRSDPLDNFSVAERQAAKKALTEAINLMFEGNRSLFARHLGVTPQAVYRWVGKGVVPAHRVPEIVELLDGTVTPKELRPDLYGVVERA